MKRLLFVTICLAFSTLYAGEKKTAALNKIAEHIKNRGKQQWTWVFYGDSITHGAAHTHGWRSFMEIWEIVVVSLALAMDAFAVSICKGLASKEKFTESEFWKNKFLYEIFKLKTKKERRIKSTFSL